MTEFQAFLLFSLGIAIGVGLFLATAAGGRILGLLFVLSLAPSLSRAQFLPDTTLHHTAIPEWSTYNSSTATTATPGVVYYGEINDPEFGTYSVWGSSQGIGIGFQASQENGVWSSDQPVVWGSDPYALASGIGAIWNAVYGTELVAILGLQFGADYTDTDNDGYSDFGEWAMGSSIVHSTNYERWKFGGPDGESDEMGYWIHNGTDWEWHAYLNNEYAEPVNPAGQQGEWAWDSENGSWFWNGPVDGMYEPWMAYGIPQLPYMPGYVPPPSEGIEWPFNPNPDPLQPEIYTQGDRYLLDGLEAIFRGIGEGKTAIVDAIVGQEEIDQESPGFHPNHDTSPDSPLLGPTQTGRIGEMFDLEMLWPQINISKRSRLEFSIPISDLVNLPEEYDPKMVWDLTDAASAISALRGLMLFGLGLWFFNAAYHAIHGTLI